MERSIGLTPLHLGLVIDNRLIAPPSQFALAQIGTFSSDSIFLLEDLIEEVNMGNVDTSDTPMLDYFAKQVLTINDLRQMAQKRDGSQKIIDQPAMNMVNNQRQVATFSDKEQASTLIESRKRRKKQMPYEVHIYNPFDIFLLNFRGGSKLSDVHLEKGHHWSKGLKQEKEYLESLTKTARKQFEQPIEIIDYARACALTGLDHLVKLRKTQFIGGSFNGEYRDVAMPFDFSPRRPKRSTVSSNDSNEMYQRYKYALEVFLLRYANPKIVREATGHATGKLTLKEIDETLLGKPILSKQMKSAMKEHWVSKGAVLYERSFSNYSWAIIQAFEEHCFNLGRRFRGYSQEFVGTPSMTTSIVFDMAPYSRREGKDLSMRIVFDENFGLPYYLIKNFDPDAKGRKLGDKNPADLINFAAGRHKGAVRKFIEYDWRTGRRALCTLREPNQDILDRASEISKRLNGSGISTYKLKGRYITAMKQR